MAATVMPLLAAVPFALIGVHLVRIALRSGAVPDRLLAAFFVSLAAGIPPRLISLRLTTTVGHTAESSAWTTAGNLLIGASLVLLVAFAWKVFRAERSWAKWLTAAFGLSMVAIVALSMRSVDASGGSGILAIAFNGLGVCSLLWAFVECCLYYGLMRRRCALGMANPVVANRFLLWSLWTGVLAFQGSAQLALRVGLWATGAGAIVSSGGDPGGLWLAALGLIKANIALVGPVAAVSVWLSFSPPAAYRRWLGADASLPA